MPETGFISRPKLVLASASPRRQELLRLAGVVPEVVPADIDETARPGETAEELVRRLAEEKAGAVEVAGNDVVLAADTVVVVDDDVLGKPGDRAEAETMLRRLSGRAHHTATGVCVRIGEQLLSEVSITSVSFRTLSDDDIEWYVATGEPMGKAGAYAIQGAAAVFVTDISGIHSGVVGLPLPVVDQLLTRIGRPLRTWAVS